MLVAWGSGGGGSTAIEDGVLQTYHPLEEEEVENGGIRGNGGSVLVC